MGRDVFSRELYAQVSDSATRGGRQSPTQDAEEQIRRGEGLDPLVDPKGLPHLGPVRMSLPRFERQGDLWMLTRGLPMAEETLLDTTGSMGYNVDLAFKVLPLSYDMLTAGTNPVLGRYDPQIATAIFNDVQDGPDIPVLCRSQFEMGEKIAGQMTKLVPGRSGCGNGKEDPQFGLFAAAYLTAASICKWGLKWYHFAVSDEPLVPIINLGWLKKIFGDDVLDRIKETGYEFTPKTMPDTARVVQDLQLKAHAFFLQVNDRPDVTSQWTDLYGGDHVVMMGSTEYLHAVKAVIIGLTEGTLDLNLVPQFLREHNVLPDAAKKITRSVANIPIGAQTTLPNFNKLPKAGDLFREKTDLWPIDQDELAALPPSSNQPDSGGVNWL